jgi:Chaperone of endosialidase
MAHTTALKTFLIIAAGVFSFTLSNAQITVLPNGNVGIGNAVPTQKLDVIVNPANPALESGRFLNNSTSNSTKYGINNTVSNAGTGGRYGIYNSISQQSTSTGTGFGLYNTVVGGNGGAYSLYSTNSGGGTGFRYGTYNYTNRTGATANTAVGLYNYTANTLGAAYGLYNYAYVSGASTSFNYGQYNYQYSAGTSSNYGLYNYVYTAASTTPGNRYGIWTEVNNSGAGVRYGIYSRSLGIANYAGYFDGNVHVQGNFTVVSDDKLKINITPVTNALEIILQLDAKNFDFRRDIKGLNLPEGPQIGLMASQVERAAPMLVKKMQTPLDTEPSVVSPPAESTSNTIPSQSQAEEMYSYNAVNYIGLVPVLIQAVKDQQNMIQKLQAELKEQKQLISTLRPKSK